MRHFSELGEGVRLLMEDELLVIAGGTGEDTDSSPESYENYYSSWLIQSGIEHIGYGQFKYVSVGTVTQYGVTNGAGETFSSGFYAHLPDGSYTYFGPGYSVENYLSETTIVRDPNGNVVVTYSGT